MHSNSASSSIATSSLVFDPLSNVGLFVNSFRSVIVANLDFPKKDANIQLLSSIFVIVVYPLQMSSIFHRILAFTGYRKTLDEHRDVVAIGFYIRSLGQCCNLRTQENRDVGVLTSLCDLHFV